MRDPDPITEYTLGVRPLRFDDVAWEYSGALARGANHYLALELGADVLIAGCGEELADSAVVNAKIQRRNRASRGPPP